MKKIVLSLNSFLFTNCEMNREKQAQSLVLMREWERRLGSCSYQPGTGAFAAEVVVMLKWGYQDRQDNDLLENLRVHSRWRLLDRLHYHGLSDELHCISQDKWVCQHFSSYYFSSLFKCSHNVLTMFSHHSLVVCGVSAKSRSSDKENTVHLIPPLLYLLLSLWQK